MSKASELRLIRGQRSADAAINYHHRSGDSEGSGGNMLDRYAQSESAEEEYFEGEEERAREVFARAFGLYLKKTLTGKERKFLKGILAGKETPAAIGKALGVKWFECLQEIQRKAFNNAEAFGRVVQLSGWSRAQEFSETVFKRLEALRAGAELNELLPQNRRIEKEREYTRLRYAKDPKGRQRLCQEWKKANSEKWLKYQRDYMERHREEINARHREQYLKNREEINAKRRARYKVDRRKILARQKELRLNIREQLREKSLEYYRKNKERLVLQSRAYYEANKSRMQEYYRSYREANAEKIRKYQRERYAKKKAAKALAGLMQASQEESQNNQAHTEKPL